MALLLQDTVLEKVFGIAVDANNGPASSEAARLLLTILPLFRDMITWSVKGMFPLLLLLVESQRWDN